eukprot:gene10078-11929_t
MYHYNYGFINNEFIIEDDIIIKKSKRNAKSFQNEINWYEFILKNNVIFPIPKIKSINSNEIKMEYLCNYKPLTYSTIGKYYDIIDMHLELLHSFDKKQISKTEYIHLIKLECYDKILDRYCQTDWGSILEIEDIMYVNDVKIHDIHYNVNKIFDKLCNIVNNLSNHELCVIHGDTHLGNILIKDDDVKFIDPRGHFGTSDIYGIKEYDYAKLLFGISGYSVFDNMDISSFNIIQTNFKIDFIDKYHIIFENGRFDTFTKLIALTIWLANNSNFISIHKKTTSLMIALYICELYLEDL